MALNFKAAISEVAKLSSGDGKLSHEAVAYQDHPNGDDQCANCSMYESPGKCDIVEDPISAAGWCRKHDQDPESGIVVHPELRKIYVVRHGQTSMNNATDTSVDRIRGWIDVPLTQVGREEALGAGEQLKGSEIEVIVTSDLSRALETATIIADAVGGGIKPIPSDMLRPWDLGGLTGQKTSEALPQISDYVINRPGTKVPPDGESFNDFKDRFFSGVVDAMEKAGDKVLCIVTHHRGERLLEAWHANGQPDDHTIDINVFLTRGDRPGGVRVMELNEAALAGEQKEDGGVSKVLELATAAPDPEDPTITVEQIEKFLREQAGAHDIADLVVKEAPGVGDVHATTALGNEDGKKKPKAKDFLTTIAEVKGGARIVEVPPNPANDEAAPGIAETGKRASGALPQKTAAVIERMLGVKLQPGGSVVAKKDAPPSLKMRDDGTAHSPFPYDANALGNLRPDQMPRLLGILTDQEDNPNLDLRTVRLASLVAIQDRVDPEKIDSMAANPPKKPPLVARVSGRNLILDGHHRLAMHYLNGDKAVEVNYADLSPVSEALKGFVDGTGAGEIAGETEWSLPLDVIKAEEDQQLVFGWASISSMNGELVIDKQGDIIPEHELESAAYEYVLYCRQQGDMHERKGVGRLVESMVFTKQKQELLGIDLGLVGWFVGFRVDDPGVWKRIKAGDLPEFSIGGKAIRD